MGSRFVSNLKFEILNSQGASDEYVWQLNGLAPKFASPACGTVNTNGGEALLVVANGSRSPPPQDNANDRCAKAQQPPDLVTFPRL